jgi:hypothetical protein
MSRKNVIYFLHTLAARPDVLDTLKVKSKAEVMTVAAGFGFPFTEDEFNELVWSLEQRLASRRNEAFDATFPLWQTMWGRYYLEYLVIDLIPSFQEAHLLG